MNHELEETEDFEADFALSGPLEWEEEEAEMDIEMSQLLARVQAARHCA